jgi:hypothetical protein
VSGTVRVLGGIRGKNSEINHKMHEDHRPCASKFELKKTNLWAAI